MFSYFLTLFVKDLRYYYQNAYNWMLMFVFYLLSIIFYAYISSDIFDIAETIDYAVIVLLFTLTNLALNHLNDEDDFRNKIYEQYYIFANASLLLFILAKYLARVCVTSAIFLMTLPAIVGLLAIDVAKLINLIPAMIIFNALLTLNMIIAASLAVASDRGVHQFISVLILPFILPLMIITIYSFNMMHGVLILVGILLLLLPVMLVLCPHIIINLKRYY